MNQAGEMPPDLEPAVPSAQESLRERIDSVGGDEAVQLALRFAALSGRFDPQDAFRAAKLPEPSTDNEETLLRRLAVVAELSSACDTEVWKPHWIMRASDRRRILEAVAEEREDLAEWRAHVPAMDAVAQDICDAIVGRGAFDPARIEAELEDPAPKEEPLERLLRGLVLAEPLAVARDRIDAVRASLAQAASSVENPLLEFGVVGRDEDLDWIAAGISEQWNGSDRLLYVGGIGGVGKSTLLAETERRARTDHNALVATLDFDRPGIEGADPLGLSLDLARQVAAAAGAAGGGLYAERLRMVRQAGSNPEEGISAGLSMIRTIADVVHSTGRPLLILLDTLESLTLRGDINTSRLIDWLANVRQTAGRVAAVAAGRGDPPPGLIRTDSDMRVLLRLDDEMARALLDRLEVKGAAARALLKIAKGNPLVLRLGARLIKDCGDDALAGEDLSAETSERVLAGQLYRLILSRLKVPEVRAIAHPGLLIRRINAKLIQEVIGPEVGIHEMDRTHADALCEALASHAWLVRSDGGWMLHRAEVRTVLLDLQIADDRNRARRLFKSAASWFAKQSEPWTPTEALYYRLQLSRWGGRLPHIDPALARLFSEDMIEDLPQRARDALAVARGERSSRLRAEEKVAAKKTARPELTVDDAQEVMMLLERRAFAEAADMVGRTAAIGELEPGSPTADAVIEALWRNGDLARARRLLSRRDRRLPDWPLPEHPDRALALLNVRADLDAGLLRDRFRREAEWSARAAALFAHGTKAAGEADVVALLMRAENRECVSPLAEALWTLWVGEPPQPEAIARLVQSELVQSAERRVRTTLSIIDPPSGTAEPCPLDRLIRRLASESIQAGMIGERIRHRLDEVPPSRMAAISGAVLEELAPEAAANAQLRAQFETGFAAKQFDTLGGLADWATMVATLLHRLRIDAMAHSARRRLCTIAGFWSYGEPPKGWRQPQLDLLSWSRLHAYLDSPDPRGAAEAAIARWAKLLPRAGKTSPQARLLKRLDPALLKAPIALIGGRAEVAAATAQAMIAAGVPLLLAPALAIRATSGALTGPEIPAVPSPAERGES